MGERIQKYLAHAGVASRRHAEALIRAGRVALDGRVVTDPASRVEPGAVVSVDGRAAVLPVRRTLALNKPVGCVTTVDDPQGRRTVLDLVPARMGRIYPVGRLDAMSEGLLLLTNDGELCNLLTHPRHAVSKTYRVLCDRTPTDAQLAQLAAGVELADGRTRPAEVRRGRQGWFDLVLWEGRNRQVRRMCAAVGLDVRRLVRVAIGPLALADLPAGRWRELRADEVEGLRAAASRREAGRVAPVAAADDPVGESRGERASMKGQVCQARDGCQGAGSRSQSGQPLPEGGRA